MNSLGRISNNQHGISNNQHGIYNIQGEQPESGEWWVVSDIFEELPMPAAPFSPGYGRSVRGKPKASCNAFKLLAKMNCRRMPVEFAGTPPDCAGIIACCDSSRIRLLIWNHCQNEVYERKT
ncbi:MAG: hypothetical protein WCI51_18735 [Lentisphaerota bacterium]